MNDFKALETRYAGRRFRSRTEARWAVFFDALGIKWDYEKDGYDLGEGAGPYLPDFWLPQSQVYAEVKGQEFTVQEVNRCRILARLSSHPVVMLPGVPEPRNYFAEMPNGLLGEHVWTGAIEEAADRAKTARFEHGETPSQERVTESAIARRGARRSEHATERGASAERELVRAMLLARSRVEEVAKSVAETSFRDADYRAIYSALIAAGPDSLIEDITANLSEPAVATVEDLLSGANVQIDAARTINDALLTLRARDLDARAAELDRIIPLASGAAKDKLIEEKVEIYKELKSTGRNYKTFRRPR